jgi:hypothetical protein
VIDDVTTADEMTPTQAPRGSTRRRWVVVGLLLIAGLVVWRIAMGHSLVTRARQIRLGQPRSEVVEQLGEPHMGYNMGVVSGECYSSRPKIELLGRVLLHQFFDLDVIPDVAAMDVEVRYDDQKRVNWIRAGTGSEPLK